MYQYKAQLKHNKELIAEGHNIEDVEKQVLHFRRQQKRGEHTEMNNEVEIIHVKRDQVTGDGKDVILKVI